MPLADLTRGGPQSKDVDTILFDGNGQPLPQVIIHYACARLLFSIYLTLYDRYSVDVQYPPNKTKQKAPPKQTKQAKQNTPKTNKQNNKQTK